MRTINEFEKWLMSFPQDDTYQPIVGDRVAMFHPLGDGSYWSSGVVLDAGRDDVYVIDESDERVYRTQSNEIYMPTLIERLTRDQLLTHHVEEVRQLGLRSEV